MNEETDESEMHEVSGYAASLNLKMSDGVLWVPADETLDDIRYRIANILWSDEALEIFQRKLEEIPGIKVLENRYDSKAFNCVNYAFGLNQGDEWALPYREVLDDAEHPLWTDTEGFLNSKGYSRYPYVLTGDIAFYESHCGGQHFGVIGTDGIHSKFGERSIVRHPFELAPLGYGRKITFFRKRRKA